MKKLSKASIQWLIAFLFATVLGVLQLFSNQLFSQAKILGYRFIEFYPLVNSEDDVINKLKIYYRDKQITSLDTILIEVTNDGSLPIKREDYDSDINISFERGIVIDAAVSNTFPPNIPVGVAFDANHVFLKPVLINPSDRILIKILVSGSGALPKVNGRIAGVKEIQEKVERKVQYRRTAFNVWSAGISGILILILAMSFLALSALPKPATLAIPKWELMVWTLILGNGGFGLLGFWGENINFALPRWLNLVLMLILFPSSIAVWYRIRLSLYNKSKETHGT